MFQSPFILESREILRFSLTPPILHLLTRYRVDQIMRKHIATFQIFKVLAYLGYN